MQQRVVQLEVTVRDAVLVAVGDGLDELLRAQGEAAAQTPLLATMGLL